MGERSFSRPILTSSRSDAEETTLPNVTLRLPVEQDHFPCPICQGLLPVKFDRKGKPYVVCDQPCGVQMFIRRREGIRRFRLLLAKGTTRNAQGLNRVLELWDYLSCRLAEIRKLESIRGPDPGLEREEKLVQSQREKVRKFLIRELREKWRELLEAGHAQRSE